MRGSLLTLARAVVGKQCEQSLMGSIQERAGGQKWERMRMDTVFRRCVVKAGNKGVSKGERDQGVMMFAFSKVGETPECVS